MLQNVCIHTAVMLEIGALYLIYMSRGKDAPFYKVDIFWGKISCYKIFKIRSVRSVEMHFWSRMMIY